MAWGADAVDGDAEAAGQLDVEDAEGNGDAAAGLENVVQTGVVGVVVIVFVAGDLELVEEVLVGGETEAAGVAEADLFGVVVELGEPGFEGEIGVFDAGNVEGRNVEVDGFVFLTEDAAERVHWAL